MTDYLTAKARDTMLTAVARGQYEFTVSAGTNYLDQCGATTDLILLCDGGQIELCETPALANGPVLYAKKRDLMLTAEKREDIVRVPEYYIMQENDYYLEMEDEGKLMLE